MTCCRICCGCCWAYCCCCCKDARRCASTAACCCCNCAVCDWIVEFFPASCTASLLSMACIWPTCSIYTFFVASDSGSDKLCAQIFSIRTFGFTSGIHIHTEHRAQVYISVTVDGSQIQSCVKHGQQVSLKSNERTLEWTNESTSNVSNGTGFAEDSVQIPRGKKRGGRGKEEGKNRKTYKVLDPRA